MKKTYYYLLIVVIVSVSCSKGSGSGSNPPVVPKISIDDLSAVEGNGGTTTFNVQVRLDQATTQQVSVKYSTADGFAKSGEDYTAVTDQTLVFAPNETTKNISITVVADDVKEGDDNFTVKLSNPVNATLFDEIATVTIRNDDTKVPFTNTGYDAPTSYPGYTLAWADEFNGSSLDATAWSNQNGDGCPTVCGWGNNEQEYYTDRPQNLFLQDGKLIIEATKESFNGKNYTSSKILTSGKKTFKFGRVDIRAKLPTGQGIWPALWMLPQNNVYGGWPSSGEIDMMELIGNLPNKVYGTIHYGTSIATHQQIGNNYTLSSGIFNNEFHVFSLEWKQDQMKLYVDNVLYSTVNKSDFGAVNYPFNENFYFIFNVAVGGDWPGNPDASTYFPQWLIVDYIRVYQ